MAVRIEIGLEKGHAENGTFRADSLPETLRFKRHEHEMDFPGGTTRQRRQKCSYLIVLDRNEQEIIRDVFIQCVADDR